MSAAPATLPDASIGILDDPLEQGRFTRGVTSAAGQRLAEGSLRIGGMHCAACSGLIEQAVMAVPGVQSAQVSAASEVATVRWDPALTQPSAVIAAIRRAGYDAVPDAAAPAREMRRREHRQALWRLFVAAFCAMQVMMMATPSYLTRGDELAPDMRQLLNWGSWVLTLPVLLFAAGPFFSGAWRFLRHGRIGMDVPVALGVAITFAASSAATFEPGGLFGREVYFDSLTMFVSFLLGARYLELRARHGAARALERTVSCMPETAWRIGSHGQAEAVSVQRLRPGDCIQVPLGQAFPADGLIEQGLTRVDESLLSGESHPVVKAPGDFVIAGSVNVLSPVTVRVERVGGDTRLEAILSMMRAAASQRPASARLADRWAGPFLWTVLLLAAGSAAVWSLIDPPRAVWVAVSVLIVTCPCALSLAAPAALVAAARGLGRRGVLVQRLDAIEVLAAVQHVFFDKTGTLTEDRMACRCVQRVADEQDGFASDEEALRVAAGLAAWSAHPFSLSLAAAAPDAPDAPRPGWTQVQEVPGQGLQACDAHGRTWRMGSALWVSGTAHVGASEAEAVSGASGIAPVWLGCEGRLLAAFAFDETLRPGAAKALSDLRADGVRVTVLTGDTPERARALAARVGADEVIAGATPQDKLDAVARAQAGGARVAMVGDGVNDAPVLALADVSLAMGQGALVARSQADAVILSNRLGDFVRARRTARKAVAIVRQNLIWAAAYNAVSIPLALAGWLPPWAAGLGMASSSLIVVFNALRAAR
jgi:Cu2+-exporting ATPase